jgi:regulator of protease activity HflC (stomatin/prohibitin superfamily)
MPSPWSSIPSAGSSGAPLSPKLPRRIALAALGAALILIVAWSGFYVVEPTELAGVRRLGTVVTTTPVGPGLHFKWPLVETVDRLQVSLDTFPVNDLTVYTIDNQSVTVGITITYRIPPEAVMHLLYEVGRSGNSDIHSNMAPIIADRALRVFAKRNTIKISEEREQIAVEIKQMVSERLHDLFGLDVLDLQLSKILYSQTFVASVEAAVKAKNDAVAASNTVNKIEYEAEQARAKARGEADAAAIRAEGEKRATITKAEADAAALHLTAEANAAAIKLRGEAIATYPKIIDMTIAEKWSGAPPQTILGNNAAVPFFQLGNGGK